MKMLELAPQLLLRPEAATETFGFLGKKGGGKTYASQKLFELLYELGVQCVALDPVGNWWGLRASADGKSTGLPVYVFGGPHGDVPLEATAGAFIARVVVARGISVVLDVSRFRKGERKRFMTEFAEEFFHLKKDHASPVHLFVEEAHVFVPQKPQKGEERMLGAMEDIVRIGRNYGIGCSLISQRAASVNKDVLTQVECLLAFQTSSYLDRRALKEWIEENDVEGLQLLGELATLHKGEALFWSPSFMRIFLKVNIAAKKTFDGSATPKVGARGAKVKKLAVVDLAEIRVAMKDAIAHAEENDVTALKQKLRKLQEKVDLAGLQQVKAAVAKPAGPSKVILVPVLDKKQLQRVEALVEKLDKMRDRLAQAQQAVVSETDNLRAMVNLVMKRVEMVVTPPSAPPSMVPAPRLTLVPRESKNGANDEKWDPPAGARKIMAALISGGLRRDVLALRALMTPASGTFSTYLSKLQGAQLVARDDANGAFILMPIGRTYIDEHPTALPVPGMDLVLAWKNEFDGKAKDMLVYLANQWPQSVSRTQLAEALNMPEASGTFSTYLSRITGKGLVMRDASRFIKAVDALMS